MLPEDYQISFNYLLAIFEPQKGEKPNFHILRRFNSFEEAICSRESKSPGGVKMLDFLLVKQDEHLVRERVSAPNKYNWFDEEEREVGWDDELGGEWEDEWEDEWEEGLMTELDLILINLNQPLDPIFQIGMPDHCTPDIAEKILTPENTSRMLLLPYKQIPHPDRLALYKKTYLFGDIVQELRKKARYKFISSGDVKGIFDQKDFQERIDEMQEVRKNFGLTAYENSVLEYLEKIHSESYCKGKKKKKLTINLSPKEVSNKIVRLEILKISTGLTLREESLLEYLKELRIKQNPDIKRKQFS